MNCRSVTEILRCFRIFKMAATAILDFWNREISLSIGVERIETHQHAKFCQNRSIGCKDIKLFRFFKMAAAVILNCRICKVLLADGVRWAIRISVPNIVKIVFLLWRYWNFSNFQNGRRRYLGFLKSWNFIGYWVGEGRDAWACQISLKSVNRLRLRFFNFTRWRPPPSWIFKFVKCYWLMVSQGHKHITIPNFVNIGRSVAEILRFFEFSRYFWNREILLVVRIQRVETHLHAKFCQNLSINCVDIKIGFLNLWNFIGSRCLEGPDT